MMCHSDPAIRSVGRNRRGKRWTPAPSRVSHCSSPLELCFRGTHQSLPITRTKDWWIWEQWVVMHCCLGRGQPGCKQGRIKLTLREMQRQATYYIGWREGERKGGMAREGRSERERERDRKRDRYYCAIDWNCCSLGSNHSWLWGCPVLRTVGCSVASLAPTHQMPVVLSSCNTCQKCLRTMPSVPQGREG